MRFLADECCDFEIVRALRVAGYEVISVQESHKGMDDNSLIAMACQEDQIFLTEDKDFGELVFAHQRKTGGVILFRFPGSARKTIGETVVKLVEQKGEALIKKFTVVQPKRVRIIEAAQ